MSSSKAARNALSKPPLVSKLPNICYGEKIVDTNSRDVVKLSFESLGLNADEEDEDEDEEKDSNDIPAFDTTVLCALSPGKVCFLLGQ